ncbi:glycoside hydrolase family 55 protein [Pontibacter ruber]|uniref:Glycoside hydrolase family 55 protein n=1 Tax=Pontibacter ruber TaxID=1343895 RepID=A0ABW5D430_9BACT|nr:glycoside hydrolase family 55 protein [Pontibacter ruber]
MEQLKINYSYLIKLLCVRGQLRKGLCFLIGILVVSCQPVKQVNDNVITSTPETLPTGPRKEQGNPVHLTPVPLNATPTEIQALLDRNHNVYFKSGTYNIGTLRINEWQHGLIWGAGRLTTTLKGNIIISGSRNITVGNFNVINDKTAKGDAVIDVIGETNGKLTLLNTLVSANKDGIAIRLKAPGQYIIQGCNPKASDIGISIENPKAIVNVFGGNLQYNRIHIQQVSGHLDARAFGMQVCKGEADIILHSPSPSGYHLIEGVRSEGSNGTNVNEVLLKVPLTTAAVNVVLRANALGSMLHFADYNASGTLILLENVNYPGEEDKSSVGVRTGSRGSARVLSFGNKYGLCYDEAPGPFVISSTTKVQSMGDLWMLPNTKDYKKPFNEPITKEAMLKAGKVVPPKLSFLTTADSVAVQIPSLPLYKVATGPRIANLSELMLNVKDFGAIPNDGRDDYAAIQKAFKTVVIDGRFWEPIYFPAGKYELSKPLFLDHLAGGGFWGDGADKTVLISTTGNGVIKSDGAGYSTFVDMGFENKAGAETKTADFDWINVVSTDKARKKSGAALQANMFYRCRFENGGFGMSVGTHRMGDGFMIIDCIFRNNRTLNGEGAAYCSENFNVHTNPLVHCTFENVDHAVLARKGSFNFYGNRLTNIQTAALRFNTIVGNGFAIVNNEMDASPAPFVATGHSSAKAHLLIDRVNVKPAATTRSASKYRLGGSVMFLNSSFPNRTIANGGGIGDNSLIIYKTIAADASTNGRAHGYFISVKRKNNKE